MNHLTVGQRAPLSNLAIDDTAPIKLKFTRQSPIEMDISCFGLDAAGKLINDDYMVFVISQPHHAGKSSSPITSRSQR